jgi:archaellum component FlaC
MSNINNEILNDISNNINQLNLDISNMDISNQITNFKIHIERLNNNVLEILNLYNIVDEINNRIDNSNNV